MAAAVALRSLWTAAWIADEVMRNTRKLNEGTPRTWHAARRLVRGGRTCGGVSGRPPDRDGSVAQRRSADKIVDVSELPFAHGVAGDVTVAERRVTLTDRSTWSIMVSSSPIRRPYSQPASASRATNRRRRAIVFIAAHFNRHSNRLRIAVQVADNCCSAVVRITNRIPEGTKWKSTFGSNRCYRSPALAIRRRTAERANKIREQ